MYEMKFAVICLFSVVLCFEAELSSAQYSRRNYNYRLKRDINLDWNGLNYRSNNGRHNANLNIGSIGYNYRGNQWNTNINHGFMNGKTTLNANYRRTHNFGVGHNWQNRQTNLEYTLKLGNRRRSINANNRPTHNFGVGYNWQNRQANLGYTLKLGKRRRSIDTRDEILEFLKIESEPRVFQKKLQTAVDMFVKTNQYTVPQLDILSVSVPDAQVTNVTVAEELVCVVKKLQIILPKSLGNFTVKMIKFLGPSYDIGDLEDFFSVDPVPEFETADDDGIEDACEVPEVPVSSESIGGGKLLEIKKFVAAVITVAMEYQQMLEE